MPNFSEAAKDIFEALHTHNFEVVLYGDGDERVFEIEKARRMLSVKNDLLCSLSDAGENSSLTMLYTSADSVTSLNSLIQTLRSIAVSKYNLLFHPKEYGREIKPRDLLSVHEARQGNSIMNICEGMYGTSRSSYLRLENARMIVRHNAKIDPEKVGARGRCVESILVENAAGERMLFPTTNLAPARAMTQHVNQGGGFHDLVGQQIARMAEDYAKLGQCSTFIYGHAQQLSEGALSLRENCRNTRRDMRRVFERLYRPTSYATEMASITEQAGLLTEADADEAVSADDLKALKEMLRVDGEQLDESVLRTVARLVEGFRPVPTVATETRKIGLARGSKAIREFENWLDRFDLGRLLERDFGASFDGHDLLDGDMMGGAEYAGQHPAHDDVDDVPLHRDLVNYFDRNATHGDPEELANTTEDDVLPRVAQHGSLEDDFQDLGLADEEPLDEFDMLADDEQLLLDDEVPLDEAVLEPGDVLRRSDNQGESLKREVQPATVTDPTTGKQVKPDTGYVNRLVAGAQTARNVRS